MALSPLSPPRSATALVASSLGDLMAEQVAKEETRAEIHAAQTAPEKSDGFSFAEQRRRFMREKTGAPFDPVDVLGELLFAKRLNFGESIHLSLLLPLASNGLIDPMQPEKLAFAMSLILRLGLWRDGKGTPYFENGEDAIAYVDDDACSDFCAAAILAIDGLNNILPKRLQPAAPAPKTRAQQRLERMRAKETPAAPGAPKRAAKRPEKARAAAKTATQPA